MRPLHLTRHIATILLTALALLLPTAVVALAKGTQRHPAPGHRHAEHRRRKHHTRRNRAAKVPNTTTKRPVPRTVTTTTPTTTTTTTTPTSPVATTPKTTTTTATVATTPTTTTTTTMTPDTEGLPFAAQSVWNQPLDALAPLDTNSQTYVSDLQQQVVSSHSWINTTSYSTPVFTVPATQPTVAVTLDKSSPGLQATWLQVPIPATAKAAAGTDEEMAVWQPSTDTMWEFWKMHQVSGVWHASWGGTMNNVSTNPGYFTAPNPNWWGATATSLPLLGGLIRPSELASGHIDHALALAIPLPRAVAYAWPAQRTDGTSTDPNAIPEGQRFRIDPSVDLSAISMTPVARMLAVAAQKYGIIVRDYSGSVSFFAEDTTAEGLSDPYHGTGGYFQGKSASQVLASFPWSHLVALQDTMSGS